MAIQDLASAVLGASHGVLALAAFSAEAGLLSDPVALGSLLSADSRLKLRLLVAFDETTTFNAIAEDESIGDLFNHGFKVRIVEEEQVRRALEYIVVDQEVAFVGKGLDFSRLRLNHVVTHSATVQQLVSHFRFLWYLASGAQDRREVLYDSRSAEGMYLPGGSLAILGEGSWNNLIRELTRNPEKLYEFSPRMFESFVAELFRSYGYQVEVTAPSRDGGRDLLVSVLNPLGDFLYFVECKRYRARTKVGVRQVRQLFGVVEQERATAGILVTTSRFTRAAIEFQRPIRRRLSLGDYDALVGWIRGQAPLAG